VHLPTVPVTARVLALTKSSLATPNSVKQQQAKSALSRNPPGTPSPSSDPLHFRRYEPKDFGLRTVDCSDEDGARDSLGQNRFSSVRFKSEKNNKRKRKSQDKNAHTYLVPCAFSKSAALPHKLFLSQCTFHVHPNTALAGSSSPSLPHYESMYRPILLHVHSNNSFNVARHGFLRPLFACEQDSMLSQLFKSNFDGFIDYEFLVLLRQGCIRVDVVAAASRLRKLSRSCGTAF
jgi:hypothetical protein